MLLELLASGDTAINPISLDPANLKAAGWALGIFLVVLFLLKKMAWGPILDGLAAREKRIEDSLEKAAEIEKNTREMAATNRKLIEEAQTEAQAIVSQAREAAVQAAEQVKAGATDEIEAQRDRFRREMQLESEKARAELRESAVELTVQATAKLVGRIVDDADHQRLVRDALTEAESVSRN